MFLQGKTAVITGCLQGIGFACMQKFAAEGADIWACCQKRSDEFEEKIAAIQQQYNIHIYPLYFDLLSEIEVKTAMK